MRVLQGLSIVASRIGMCFGGHPKPQTQDVDLPCLLVNSLFGCIGVT